MFRYNLGSLIKIIVCGSVDKFYFPSSEYNIFINILLFRRNIECLGVFNGLLKNGLLYDMFSKVC